MCFIWTDAVAQDSVVINYTYDNLDRLVEMDRSDGALVEFNYDEVSNTTSDTLSINLDSDTDGDQISDQNDNCIEVQNVSQRDTDQDGYGNACDADFNNDGLVNLQDYITFRQAFGGDTSVDADFDGDGLVDIKDYRVFGQLFDKAPGPSGLAP